MAASFFYKQGLLAIALAGPCVYCNACLCCCVQVALATFAAYTLANANNPEQRLTADRAFVALSLFNILRFPLTMLPMVLTSLLQVGRALMGLHHWRLRHCLHDYNYVSVTSQASVSLKRLSKFLQNEELDQNMIDWVPEMDSEFVVVVVVVDIC